MQGIDLGSVYARVMVDTSGMSAGIADARKQIESLGASAPQSIKNTTAAMEGLRSKSVETVYSLRTIGYAMREVGGFASRMGEVGVGAITKLVTKGAELNQTLVQIRNNTVMTDSEFAEMTEQTKKLGVETGASMQQIAMGARHIRDYGFTGKAAMLQLEEGTKAAVATGTDAGDTVQLLSRVMKIFGIESSKTAGAMNALWYAAANSNLTMNQFVQNTGRAFAVAKPLGFTFNETAAALSVFAGQGLNASQSATQLINDFKKLHSPTKQTSDYLDFLATKAGPDLRAAFTTAGNQVNQISGSFQLLAEKSKASGIPLAEMITHLFPGLRGEAGALIGTTATGLAGMAFRLEDINQMMEGRSVPLTGRFADAQKQLGVQLAILNNAWTVMASTIATQVVPLIVPVINWLKEMALAFSNLPPVVQVLAATIAGLGGGILLFGGKIIGLLGIFVQMKAALIAIPWIQAAQGIATTGAAAGTASIGFGALLGTVGLIAVAVAALVGVTYLVVKAMSEANKSALDMAKSDEIAQKAKAEQARVLSRLQDEYDKLALKTNKTKEETQKFHDIANQIVHAYPGIEVAYDSLGNAILRVGDKAAITKQIIADLNAEMAGFKSKALLGQEMGEQIGNIQSEVRQHQRNIASGMITRTRHEVMQTARGPHNIGIVETVPLSSADREAENARMRALLTDQTKLQKAFHDLYNPPAPPKPAAPKKLVTGNPPDEFKDWMDDQEEAGKRQRHAASEAAKLARQHAAAMKDMRLDMAKLSGDSETYAFAKALEEFYAGKKAGVPIEELTARLRAAAEKATGDALKVKVAEDKKLAVKVKAQKAKADKEVADLLKEIKEGVGPEFKLWMDAFKARSDMEDKIFELTNGEGAIKRRDIGREFIKNYSKENLDVAEKVRDLQMDALQRSEANQLRGQFGGFTTFAEGFAQSMKSVQGNIGLMDFKGSLGKRTMGQFGFDDVVSDIEKLAAMKKNVTADTFEDIMKETAKLYKFANEQEDIAGENYIRFLDFELENTKKFSDEWMSLMKERKKVEDDLNKDDKLKKDKPEKVFNLWRDSARRLKGDFARIFSQMFEDLFSGHKNFLKTFLHAFKEMLIKMAAELAASSIMHSLSGLFGGLFGGGGKKGGGTAGSGGGGFSFGGAIGSIIGGIGGLLGFAEGGLVPGPMGMPQLATVHGGEFVVSNRMQESGGMGNVIVNLNGVHIANDYSVERLVDQIAWHSKRRLAVSPGTV